MSELSHCTPDEIIALRNRIVHVVGHALRTPVRTALGFAGALQEADPTEVREVIGPALLRSMRSLAALVDDLLLASSLDTVLPTGPRVATNAGEAVRREWATAGSPRELRLEGEATAAVLAPAGAFEHLLRHVLDNAARYGTGPVTVHVGAADGAVVLRVDVPGPSPSDRDLALAFEPFYRGEHAVMASSGLGLGLTVARRLADHCAGAVALGRLEEGGASTTISMPLAQGPHAGGAHGG